MILRLQKITSLTVALLFMLVIFSGSASAISGTALRSIIGYTPFYGEEKDGVGAAETCGLTGTSAGMSNKEQVWTYLARKGLKSIAIAGMMGNFKEENASFDPATKQNYTTVAIPSSGDGITGYGIAQWTYKERQAKLFKKIDEAGLSKYYGEKYGNPDLNKELISKEDNDKLLLVELDFMWNDDTTPVKSLAEELNKKTSVAGDNGSTVFFHNTYENSDDNAAGIQERVDSAKEILAELGSNSCGTLGGVSSVEDAIPWADKFVEAISTRFGAQTSPLRGGVAMGDGKSYYSVADGTTCTFDTSMGCEQCTALSGWFVATMTEYTYAGGDGDAVVGNLDARGVPTGKDPKPFSVFSMTAGNVGNQYGHTGVVLGVLENGDVITLENNWPSGKVSIRQYNITKDYPNVTFAYVGNKMKNTTLNNE